MRNGLRTELSSSGIGAIAMAPEPALALRLAAVRIVGIPKTGLRIGLYDDRSQLVIHGRSDPTFLYVIFGTALAVTVMGTAFASPRYGVLGTMLFSVLFSPLLIFAALASVRLRTRCVVDRGERTVTVTDRSYVGGFARVWPLDALEKVTVVTSALSPWPLRSAVYQLQVVFAGERYLVEVGPAERELMRKAHRVSRFAGVPVTVERMPSPQAARGLDVGFALGLFLVPVVGSTASFAYVFRDRSPDVDGLLVSIGALIVAQIGALLAYGYRRARTGNAV